MFAGFGGEALYRPIDKKFAIGASMHKVCKVVIAIWLDYSNVTGHLSLYLALPNQVNSHIDR